MRAQLFSLVPRECAFSLLNGAEKRGNSVTPRKREEREEEKDKFEKCSRKKKLEWKSLLTP